VILSKRERYIVIGVVAVIAVFALDRMLISPLLASREELKNSITAAKFKYRDNQILIKNDPTKKVEWKGMQDKGLKADKCLVEGQVLQLLNDWAKEARLNLTTEKPEREETMGVKPNDKEKPFRRVTFRAAGTGNAYQVSEFVKKIQAGSIPIKINELAISSRKDGVDDLNLSLSIYALLLAEQQDKPAPKTDAVSTPKEGKS